MKSKKQISRALIMSFVSFLFLLFILFVLVPRSANAAVLQNNEGTSIDTENYGTSGGFKGQSFEHTANFDITSIEIWGGLGNSPATLANIRVYEGGGDAGTEICTETNIDVTGWPNWSVADWQDISLSSCTGLVASSEYTFVLEAVDGSGSDAIRWATSDTSYAFGIEYFNGSGRGTRDAMFRINGTETGDPDPDPDPTGTSTIQYVDNPVANLQGGLIILIMSIALTIYMYRRKAL